MIAFKHSYSEKIILPTVLLLAALGNISAFLPTLKSTRTLITSNLQSNVRTSNMQMSANGQNIVVISPPGGVGEVAAVQAAQMGSSVKWFVVSPPSQTSSAVSISSEAIQSIEGKGSLELAGASAETLLLPLDDPSSAIKAVSTWCANANGIICTVDGIEEAVMDAARVPGASAKQVDPAELRKNNDLVSDAIKVAAKEACSTSSSTMKVAVMPAEMDIPKKSRKNADDDESEEGGNFLSSLFGGNKVDVPKTLSKAMNPSATLRYGELFGIPESSVSYFLHLFLKEYA